MKFGETNELGAIVARLESGARTGSEFWLSADARKSKCRRSVHAYHQY